ncbi:MAG: arsenite methyltransferase [Sedimentisphaerales bacterium]
MVNLNRNQIWEIVKELENSVAREECLTCECFQGLLTQLELDSPEEISDLTLHLKVSTEQMHGCLGCKPCPGGDLFADYLRGKKNLNSYREREGNIVMDCESENEKIRETVRDGYTSIAHGSSGCCCGSSSPDKLAEAIGYTTEELEALPEGANMGLSCGNPNAIANLQSGQVVLDLGSGGGFDVFIAAEKVGPEGKSIGVDMTPDMLSKARASIPKFNEKTGLSNVEFRLGEIEHLPVADASIDVVISNCVINLSPDKQQVWNEIARVLKPGGKACISDLALKKVPPEEILKSVAARVGCIAGAVLIEQTLEMATQAGLRDIKIEEKEYAIDVMVDCNDPLYKLVKEALPEGTKLSDYVVSVNITASKGT